MTREQAINSMISHGFTVEQTGEIIKAVTPQFSSGLDKNSKKLEKGTTKNDCEHCSKTYGTLGCCDFVSNEPVYSCKEGHEEYARGIRKLGTTTKNNLGVEKVTALAEWTEKLTKASEDAYNKGYADGMKAQDKNCSDCEVVQACIKTGIRSTSKALSILDKIRAEIEELKPNNPNFKGYFEQNVALNKVLEILDKYKAESEA